MIFPVQRITGGLAGPLHESQNLGWGGGYVSSKFQGDAAVLLVRDSAFSSTAVTGL